MTYVYVIGPHDPGMELPTPSIKIGKAKDPNLRLRTLQTGSPQLLTHYALWEFETETDAASVESACHRTFRARRARGEWFNVLCSDVHGLVHGRLFYKYRPSLRLYAPHH